ncbi:MAG: glycosyltransferase [Bacteroidaceae bacterium]|nr:glycosyltransferase [Bacteroidaceae bacterium]MBR6819429.1 glycosyltransferase [Bacteroidaceae bacterium]MBR7052541.1 glycosyltransferase [Bacteroidaceae bacterium]
MTSASIVTYDHHLLDIEPTLRSLLDSPVDAIYVIDHSEHMFELERELKEYETNYIRKRPDMKSRLRQGFMLRYERHRNNGYGGGHNVAIRMARERGSEYHLVVNPDVWFGHEVVPVLQAYMTTYKDVAQMMPQIRFPNGEPQRLAKLLPTPRNIFARALNMGGGEERNRRYELVPTGLRRIVNAPYLSGCFMFLRMKALEEVGDFDEKHFFMYAEDIDLTRRLHRRWRTLYFPKVVVYHKFNRASHRSFKLFVTHVWNIVKYFNRYGWIRDAERDRMNERVVKQYFSAPDRSL